MPAELHAALADASTAVTSKEIETATGLCDMISVPQSWARFLFHLVRVLGPRSCLEVGTGVGISAIYQAAALDFNGAGTLISVDTGDHARAAERSFADLDLSSRASVVIDSPGVGIERAIELGAPFDLALLDADHSEVGTIRDFDAVLPHLADSAVVVVDDIAWSGEMQRAWETIRQRPRVDLVLDLHRFGLLTVRRSPSEP